MVGKLNILNIDSDKGLRKALGRYLVVTEDKELPLFLLCDSIEAEKMESEGMLEMWKEHDKKMNELNWMKNQGLQKEDLTETDYSLLDLKIDLAEKNVESCTLCERKCSVNRKNGKVGFCGVGYHSRVANTFVHHGEEPELVPSGTIDVCFAKIGISVSTLQKGISGNQKKSQIGLEKNLIIMK